MGLIIIHTRKKPACPWIRPAGASWEDFMRHMTNVNKENIFWVIVKNREKFEICNIWTD